MKNIAVILAGSGVFDGSEIYESVVTFIALEKAGVSYQCFAPNIAQADVVNHLSQSTMDESRNVLVEAGRLTRGNVKDLAQIDVSQFDGLILPGGFGVAKNLCNFAEKGSDCIVNACVEGTIRAFKRAHKPVGFMCISPVIAAKIYGDQLQCTIGHDGELTKTINAMGAEHVDCTVDNIVIDQRHKVVTTPAFMLGQKVTDIVVGIEKLVAAVIRMA